MRNYGASALNCRNSVVSCCQCRANDLTQIEENGATSGPGLLASYVYNNLGQRVSVSRGGGSGVATSYAYDGAERLQSLSHTFPSPNAGNSETITLALVR